MDDKIKKIFAQLDRIGKKLEYIERSLSVFDGQDQGQPEESRHA